jgi:pimeloyl-ACP methyl ester carboxylesterase
MKIPPSKARIKLSQGTIFWRETGQRKPDVIFLHGSWYDSNQWLEIMHLLAYDCHCVAVDLPGCGNSDYDINTNYSIDLMVKSLADYIDTLKYKQVYLVGHSLGAWVAASYALKYENQIEGLILLSPEGLKVENGGKRWQKEQLLVGKFPLLFWLAHLISPFAKLLRCEKLVKKILQERQQLLKSAAAYQIFLHRREAEKNSELLDAKIENLKVPTLILQHSQESEIVSNIIKNYTQLLPMVELRVIDSPPGELTKTTPDIVAEYIRVFVDGLLIKWYG